MVKNAYIHIPFCVKKCPYCAFVSYNKLQKKSQYISALIKEINANYKGEKLSTLYLGGGTPSLLKIDELKELVSCFNISDDVEFTIELNPNKITIEYLQGLYDCGVNRLSIGIQAFDDNLLKQIGRLHSVQDALTVIENAKKVGINNISIDLIYGLPNQSMKDFEHSLLIAKDLDIKHISLYGLKIEEGTEFDINTPLNLPDEDMQADMFLKSVELLEPSGFMRYEVSNFAKIGFESKHNTNYWKNNSYYGFGAGAHGYQDGIRYENQTDLDLYIENPIDKLTTTLLTKEDILCEEIILGFRQVKGLNIKEINSKFNIDFDKKYEDIINKYLSLGYLCKTSVGYALSTHGTLISNEILCEFV